MLRTRWETTPLYIVIKVSPISHQFRPSGLTTLICNHADKSCMMHDYKSLSHSLWITISQHPTIIQSVVISNPNTYG